MFDRLFKVKVHYKDDSVQVFDSQRAYEVIRILDNRSLLNDPNISFIFIENKG